MKRYEGFQPRLSTARENLAPGGYVARIMKAEDVQFDRGGHALMVSFDIAEGEERGFFARDYKNNTFDNKKWRGVKYLSHPKGDGTEKDGWSVSAMNNFIGVLQESNPGFTWDWGPVEKGDYSQLKGKLLGVLYGKTEWSYNGKTGWNTKCRALIPAEDVRQGNFETPADKPLNQPATAQPLSQADNMAAELTDDDLPF